MYRQFRSFLFAVSVCAWVAATAATAQTLTVTYPSASTVTPPLSQLPDGPKPQGNTEHAHRPVPSHAGQGGGQDTAVQTSAGPLISATGGTSFDGPGANGYAPSDSNIAVGPSHIFAAVNSVYTIYDKSGGVIVGPKTLSSLWTGVGGGCATANAGDVVVQYDKPADRWILTQLSSLSNPYGECIAVSTTGDPKGTYNAYYYSFGSNLPDYPKFGVWPTTTNSAYLASYNQFANGASFAGAALCAYDRSAMLVGAASPAQICYTVNDASYLPSDLDGSTPPADGTPGFFVTYETLSSLRLWKLAPNFAAPNSSTLTQVTPDLSVTAFSELCGGGTCVPQSGTTNQLDSLGDRPMYRLAYRNFGDHQSMVFNHSVTSGVRWYELRANSGTTSSYTVAQQSTYAPDSTFRWMGSAAMDHAGNLAIGYSASSSSVHPAVRYSGRLSTDPPNTLASEASIIEGPGSQTNGLHRWGDYSSLRIDPTDDCTFWYINEYLKNSGAFNWSTRIGSFAFTGCGTASPDFSLSASPTSLTVPRGNTATSTIKVNGTNGYAATVTLSASGCPNGAICSFNPSSGTSGLSSTLSVATSATTPAGTYTITVNGSDGVLSHTTTFAVTVSDFSIAANPTSFPVTQGSSNTSTISVGSLFGFTTSVALSVGATCPSNATCSFNTNPVTPGGNSMLTISAGATTPAATYNVIVTGTAGGLSHSVTLTVTVNAPASTFAVSVSPASITVNRKSSNPATVTVAGNSTSVALSVSGVPSKITATLSPTSVAAGGGSSTLTISANPAASVGTFPLTITGTSGTVTKTATLQVTIN